MFKHGIDNNHQSIEVLATTKDTLAQSVNADDYRGMHTDNTNALQEHAEHKDILHLCSVEGPARQAALPSHGGLLSNRFIYRTAEKTDVRLTWQRAKDGLTHNDIQD